MTTVFRAVACAVALSAATATVEAQTWKSGTASRQLRGEKHLQVHVEFAAGAFTLGRGPADQLYRSRARYDADQFDSRHSFDPSSSSVRIELTPHRSRETDVEDDRYQELEIALSPAVPLALDLTFGAATADIDLGGLSVESAHIKTGASGSVVRFSEPNRIACRRLEIAVGAAEFLMEKLGNARCEIMEAAGGVGTVTLDFTGDWPAEFTTRAEVTVGLGELTLRVPDDLGVAIQMHKLLASFDPAGFERRGSRYVSDNFDAAAAHLELEINAVLGGVSVEWVPSTR